MGIFMLFTNTLPDAIFCYLETCNVYVCGVIDIVLHICTNFHGHLC